MQKTPAFNFKVALVNALTYTPNFRAIGSRLWKIINTKATSILLLIFVAIGLGVTSGSADKLVGSSYQFGTVYQYFLLSNKDNASANTDNTPFIGGAIGSGGVTGSFSYDGITQNTGGTGNDAKQRVKDAKAFSSMMSTYSKFKYFSNHPQGFDAIIPMIGRVIAGVILVPVGLITDSLNAIMKVIATIIIKYNVIAFLASAFLNTGAGDFFTNTLGIARDAVKGMVTALMSFAIIIVLITLMKAMRGGSSNIDRTAMSKMKGRLFMIFLFPTIIAGAGMILNEVGNLSIVNSADTPAFSKYLIDDRTWAFDYNFAPNGDSASGKGGFTGKDKNGSYVNLTFNPYRKEGADRITAINSHSTIMGGDGKNFGAFPNSAIAMAYALSQSFTAKDYIDYQGTDEAKGSYGYFKGHVDADMGTNGKHYLKSPDKGYINSALDQSDDALQKKSIIDWLKGEEKTNYEQVIADYKHGNNIDAWKARFIYGWKDSGSGSGDKSTLKQYYTAGPSREQVESGVGTQGKQSLSDQTMFLVLSSQFNENGGKYALEAPATGIKAAMAQFDSNRADYYSVSMVGNWLITIPAMLIQPIIQIVMFCAVILAVMAIGIVDMNVKPIKTFFKGATLGDIEYGWAFLMYAIGITGTYMALMVVPALSIKFMTGVIGGISSAISTTIKPSGTGISPEESLMIWGMPLFAELLFALAFALAFFKIPAFRDKLMSLYIMIWEWADENAMKFERQADSGGIGQKLARRREKEKQEHANNAKEIAENGLGSFVKNRVSDKLGTTAKKDLWKNNPMNPRNVKRSEKADKMQKERVPKREVTMPDFQKANDETLENAGSVLSSFNDMNPDASQKVRDSAEWAEKTVEAYRYNPTPKNKKQTLDAISQLQDDAHADSNENDTKYSNVSLDDVDKVRDGISVMRSVNKVPDDLGSASFARPLEEDVKSSDSAENATKQPVSGSKNTGDSDQTDTALPTDNNADLPTTDGQHGTDNDVKSSISPVAESAKRVINAETVKNSTLTDGEVDDKTTDSDIDPKTLSRDAKENLNVTDGEITKSTQAELAGTNRTVQSTADEKVDVKEPIINKSANVDLTGTDRIVNSTGKENVNVTDSNVTGTEPLNGADKTVNQTVQQQVKPDVSRGVNDAAQTIHQDVQQADVKVQDAMQNISQHVQGSNEPVAGATQTVQQQVNPDVSAGISDTTQTVTRKVQGSNEPVSDATQTVQQRVERANTNVADTTQTVQQRVTPARVTSNLTSALGTAGAQPAMRQAVQKVAKAESSKELTQAMKSLKEAMVKLPPEQRSGVNNIKLHDTLVSKSDALKPTSLKED